MDPAPGPRWTRKRLSAMLIDCYGPTPARRCRRCRRRPVRRRHTVDGAPLDRRRPARIAPPQTGDPASVGSRNCSAARRSSNGATSSSTSTHWTRSAHWAMSGHPAGLASTRVARRAHRRHRRNPRKALAPSRRHQSQQASTGRTPPPRHNAGQRHAADTLSRPGPRARRDDPPAGLARPPDPAAAHAAARRCGWPTRRRWTSRR